MLLSPDGSDPEGSELREEDSLLDSEEDGGALDSLELTGGALDSLELAGGTLDSLELTGGALDSLELAGGALDSLELTGGQLEEDSEEEGALDDGGAEEDGPGHGHQGSALLEGSGPGSGLGSVSGFSSELLKPHSGFSLSSEDEELLSGTSCWM